MSIRCSLVRAIAGGRWLVRVKRRLTSVSWRSMALCGGRVCWCRVCVLKGCVAHPPRQPLLSSTRMLRPGGSNFKPESELANVRDVSTFVRGHKTASLLIVPRRSRMTNLLPRHRDVRLAQRHRRPLPNRGCGDPSPILDSSLASTP